MSSQPTKPNPAAANLIIHVVRMTGAMFLLAGGSLALNLGGFADVLGLLDGGKNQIVGGAIALVGLMDVIVVPRLLEAKFNPKI